MKQAVHEGSGKMANGRMHHHARRLVDYGEVVVEVDDVEVDGLGLQHKFARRLRQHHRDFFAGLNPVVGLDGLTIYADCAHLGRLLNAVSRGFLQEIKQKLINPQRALARFGQKAMVYKKLLVGAHCVVCLVVQFNHSFDRRAVWPESLRSR